MFTKGVALDVTAFISAQEFILAQNHDREPADPFARQCYAEVIQSLIFQPQVWVMHPVKARPVPDDFGTEPRLLRLLLALGLVAPISLTQPQEDEAIRKETSLLRRLNRDGVQILLDFVRHSSRADEVQAGQGAATTFGDRLAAWGTYQDQMVRGAPGSHPDRVPTSDGIDDTPLGDWARDVERVAGGAFSEVVGDSAPKYLVAQLVRGLAYHERAAAGSLVYQSHPMRRDFTLAFDLADKGASDAWRMDIVEAVRGIGVSLQEAAGRNRVVELRLLELELPLLGGRIWERQDLGRYGDEEWLGIVVRKVAEYRSRAAPLRRALSTGVSYEAYPRLRRDIDVVTSRLLERLGLAEVEQTPLEREIAEAVDSVSERALEKLPRMGATWLAARRIQSRYAPPRTETQRFLYKEFSKALRRARE